MLDRYGSARAPGLRELNEALSPRAALVRMFDLEIAARCLVLDTIVRMPDSTPEVTESVEEAIEDLQERLVGAIERGRAVGEIAGSVDAAGAAADRLLGDLDPAMDLGTSSSVHARRSAPGCLRQAPWMAAGGSPSATVP
ncbi:MAG: hypothetical protein OXP69_03155 [Spirochaetaceae bacterium]|nr:hypothetical protein [Spirochaetaceae bacterium]